MRETLFLSALLLAMQVEVAPQPEIRVAQGTLTATQVRTLSATPVVVIAAPGAGKSIQLDSVQFHLDWVANAYDSVGANEDFYFSYASGTTMSGATDSLSGLNVAATADAYGGRVFGVMTGGHVLIGNSAVRISVSVAELAAADNDANGDSPIHYSIRYRVVDLDLS